MSSPMATPTKAELGSTSGSMGETIKPKKDASEPGSLLGLSLTRPINSVAAFGSSAATAEQPELPATPGRLPPPSPPGHSHDISKKIVKQYGPLVKRAEGRRLNRLAPADTSPLRPDEMNTSRSMKKELDVILGKAGTASESSGGAGSWDKLMGSDGFQKKLNFLTSTARTGHFVEEYGAEGRFEGDFLYGMRHGKGTHTFRGEVYEGDWKWDQRHGFGTFTAADGSQIKGDWEAGKPHGYTTMVDKNGNTVYEGEYKNGKRHGLGRQVFESGDTYDGGWHEGKLHDRGVYYFASGDKLLGHWAHGKYDGIGVFHYKDGSVSRRVYKDGILMSVQDYEQASKRFGRSITREGMQKHTAHAEFPKDVFLLSAA